MLAHMSTSKSVRYVFFGESFVVFEVVKSFRFFGHSAHFPPSDVVSKESKVASAATKKLQMVQERHC